MLVYKCDGCGKIIGKNEMLYEITINEEAPDVGDWRKVKREAMLHLCGTCYGLLQEAFKAVPIKLESVPWEEDK